MNILKLSGLAGLSLVALSTFNACTDYTPFNEADIFHHEYSKNFFAKYGNFPADMNWDLSDQPRTTATDPSVFDLGWNGGARTRAITPGNVHVTKLDGDDDWYNVDKPTQNWALEHLKEGRNNTLEGHPFSLVFPESGDNKFAIIPIFKGSAVITWELCLSDGTNEIKLWEPWPLTDEDDEDWGGKKPTYSTSDIQYYDNVWLDVPYTADLSSEEEHLKDKPVHSRPIIVSGVTGEFYLYLKTTYIKDNAEHQYGSKGDIQSSIGGCMSALNCDAPANINDYKSMLGMTEDITNVMVIGCEDHTEGTVDWDINDIVFLFVGLPQLPTKREVTKSKRYLIEDLGTTVDFDFNDVVVDVNQTSLIDIENGTEVVYTQEAIIKHLCGTVPFNLHFVDKDGDVNVSFNEGEDIQGEVQNVNEECKGADGKYKYRLVYSKNASNLDVESTENPFWGPWSEGFRENNIRIVVNDNRSTAWDNENLKTADFSKPGDTGAPYIIAVPTTVPWTSEHQDFPIDKVTEYNTSATAPDND